jgi:hypothetical protein
MTTLNILGTDWRYDFEDETVGSGTTGMRALVYVSGPVRTTNEVYSALAAAVDDFIAMGFKNPMLPVTPNEYTMENKAFISRTSAEKLREGTIKADWSLVGSAGDNTGRGVLKVGYSGGTNFVAGDIGRLVTQGDSGDTGTLLAFDLDPNGDTVAWIRPDDSTPTTGDIFDGTGTLIVTGGTGSTTASVAGISGQTDFVAIQAIGSVPTATEVYAVQNRIKMADAATGAFQWWATDPTVSLGIISILVMTRNSGVLIADGDIEVFARRYGSLYDNFRLNVAAGGFSALPLSSAPDVNNTTGFRTTGVLTGVGGTWTVGNGVYIGATWATATAQGVITETNTNTELEYYLVGDLADLTSTTAIKEYDFVTQSDGDATATTATVGINSGGPTDAGAAEGGSVTITIGNTTRDHDNTGVAEPYSIIVDAQGDVPIAKVYERIKYVTRRGQDNTFWDTVSCSVPGEQFRGVEMLLYVDTPTGTLVEGEDLVGQNTWTSRLMASRTGVTGEGVAQAYITVADIQTSVATVVNNDTISDVGPTDSVVVDTAGAGGAIVVHASVKQSPFGSFTGSQIFGAPGIDFRNPAGADTQAYILKDDLGTLRTPPNTVSYTVTNTRALDKVLVARDTGTSGVIDKDQFGGSHATNNALGDTTFECAGSVDVEVPPVGVLRVVAIDEQEEHRYVYSSRTTGAGGIFTLKAVTEGTSVTTGSTTQLIDTTGAFTTNGTEVGMLVRNTFGGKTTHVWQITNIVDANTVDVTPLYGSPDDWDVGDTYTINTLVQTYDANDNVFDLILDIEEDVGTDGTPGSVSNSFVKTPAANFGTVVQVRQGKIILPFEQNQTQGDGNTSVTAVRQPDTIAV